MSSSETLCLRWNAFESNIKHGFSQLRDDEDFFDVTLACGSRQIKAHKVILSACSSFFRSLIKSVPHQHPLLYLRGVDFNHLESVLSFMYNGEVRVEQKELNDFLSVAQELKVGGLIDEGASVCLPGLQKNNNPTVNEEKSFSSESWIPFVDEDDESHSEGTSPLIIDPDEIVSEHDNGSEMETSESAINSFGHVQSETRHIKDKSESSIVLQEINTSHNSTLDIDAPEISAETNKIMDSQLLKCISSNRDVDKQYCCLKCPYRSRFKRHVMNHVEARHIQFDSFPCKKCDLTFKTREYLSKHKSRAHRRDPVYFIAT